MLSLIIPGEESMAGDNMDTYLQPLLEKLQLFWHEGVWVRDAANFNGTFHFKFKTILMWYIYDFPTFRIMAGHVIKGYCRKPSFGLATKAKGVARVWAKRKPGSHITYSRECKKV